MHAELDHLTVNQLQNENRERGLAVTGIKSDLFRRIIEYDVHYGLPTEAQLRYLKGLAIKTGQEIRNCDRINKSCASSRIDELKEKERSRGLELG